MSKIVRYVQDFVEQVIHHGNRRSVRCSPQILVQSYVDMVRLGKIRDNMNPNNLVYSSVPCVFDLRSTCVQAVF